MLTEYYWISSASLHPPTSVARSAGFAHVFAWLVLGFRCAPPQALRFHPLRGFKNWFAGARQRSCPPASRALIIFPDESCGLRPRLYAVVRSADSQSFGRPKFDSSPKLLLRERSGLDCTGTFVIHENDAARADNAFRHLERGRDRAPGKQTFSLAQSYRIDH